MTAELKTQVKVYFAINNRDQKWLAKEIGIQPSQLSDILNGKRKGKKTDEYIKEIKRILNISD